MSLTTDDLIWTVNNHRQKLGLLAIDVTRRPSSTESWNKKTKRFERGETIEVRTERDLLIKSINWGVITSYLRGMLQAFTDAPVAAPERPLVATGRRLEV